MVHRAGRCSTEQAASQCKDPDVLEDAELQPAAGSKKAPSSEQCQQNLELVRPLGNNRLMRLCYCPEGAGMSLMSWPC